ncbi:MAG: PAS domain-containing protein [Chloroflexi bacterium]|nr:PAS domain-containing protein [Chloroflexota bacterium]
MSAPRTSQSPPGYAPGDGQGPSAAHRPDRRWLRVPRPFLPLRIQLGLLLGTVAALAVAIPTILHALVLLDDLERSVNDQNLELARVVGALAEQRIDQTILTLEMIAASPGFAEDVDLRDNGQMHERLAQAVRLDQALSSASIVDRQGVTWAHTIDDPRMLSQDDPRAPGVQEALKTGKPALGQAIRGNVTGRAVVPIVVPFSDRHGATGGALKGWLSLERLNAMVDGVRGAARGNVRLYDGFGRLLTAPNPEQILADLPASSLAARDALDGRVSTRRMTDATGEPVYAAALPLKQGWVVEAYQPVDVARAALYGQFVRIGLFALAAFVAAMLVGILVARRISAPLVAVLRALRSIRDDEHGPALRRSSTLEVAQLVAELDAVRDALNRRSAETQETLGLLQRYRLLAEQMHDLVLFVDEDGRIVEANPAAEHGYGLAREELIGRPMNDLLGGPEHVLRGEEIAQAMQEGMRFEASHRRSDGTLFPVEVALFGADLSGRQLLISIARDLTDRLRSDETRARMLLHEREARAREERAAEVTGIVQHMPCGVLVFDGDGILILANEQATDMLSPAPSVTGTSAGATGTVLHPSQLLDARLLGPCRALVSRALGGKVVSGQELRLGLAGGEGRAVVGSAAPLRSPEGEIHGAVAVLVDVTRERRLVHDLTVSESTLRHSLESLLVLHEASRDLGSTLVEEEIGQRLVESCVRIARLDAALVFLDDGLGDVRLLGQDGDPLLTEHIRRCDSLRQARLAALEEASSPSVLAVPACPETGMVVGQFVVLRARGRALGVLEIYGAEHRAVVTQDALASLAAHAVSALDNARLYREVGDRELRLQDALRKLLIAQEEERRRVAYDLHDGLAQVAAATHMSLQTFASQYRPRSQETRQQLERSLELARRVVREARQAIAGLRPTTLDDFGLERALRLHIQELNSDGWSIEYHAGLGPARLPGPIETVLFRITQEALTNVRKHAETLVATVSLQRQDGYVDLEVADRGAGFVVGAPPTEASPGQRLGLVGMRERAALVGGTCTVESQPGRGTRVAVRIPLGVVALPPAGETPAVESSNYVA